MKISSMWKIAVLALWLVLAGACGDATDGGDGDGGTEPQVPTHPVADVGDACVDSDECPGQVCDKQYGGCVDCYLTLHCPDEMVCIAGECVTQDGCATDADCVPGVCGDNGQCVECEVDADCPTGLVCQEHVCRPPHDPCDEFADCAPVGAVCLEDEGVCGTCTDETQCGDYEMCEDGECKPDLCIPSEAVCIGPVVKVCRADGKGYYQVVCPDGQSCYAGACVSDACEPGTSYCEKYELKQCTETGMLLTKGCGVGEECIGEGCQPMRHRVLVVFDTSGSMDHYPGTPDWPHMCGEGEIEDCFQPYPICETEDAPFTILGVSKKVFSDFFGDADSQNVVFGLQRFPQTPTVEAPTCSGGYYAGATEITGDNNALSIPLEMDNWFDASLSEVIVQGFPGSSETSNVDQLQRWLDFTEWTVDTETPCTTTLDCSEGICSGIPGNKFCKTFVNPELRADGWTPLGKSLFYAGEYMRKYVVLDGKACAGDADCPSPGYYCGEGGKCFDPLRECRLNVIVLFTDGGETEYPFATDFFNPVVQAKRLRFGLGCETDEDCSDVDYCKKDEDNPEEYGCYIPRCQPSASEPGVKYCSHDLIESDSSDPVEIQMPGFNRVLDYNGNPIDIITTVVDASVASTEETTATLNNNRRIALYGGGLHVVVNTGDVPDFLAQLKKTIDFKELFTDCAIAGVQ